MMGKTSFLDTGWARIVAALVALAAAGVLVYLNRGLLEDAPQEVSQGGSACLDGRLAEIEAQVKTGAVRPGNAAELRMRARQDCAGAN